MVQSPGTGRTWPPLWRKHAVLRGRQRVTPCLDRKSTQLHRGLGETRKPGLFLCPVACLAPLCATLVVATLPDEFQIPSWPSLSATSECSHSGHRTSVRGSPGENTRRCPGGLAVGCLRSTSSLKRRQDSDPSVHSLVESVNLHEAHIPVLPRPSGSSEVEPEPEEPARKKPLTGRAVHRGQTVQGRLRRT